MCQFAQGGALDAEISKIWTFQAGGGNEVESYDLAAFYYTYAFQLGETEGTKPFFFFTGDEGLYPEVREDWIRDKLGIPVEKAPTVQDLFRDLRSKFHVFLLYKPYSIASKRPKIRDAWEKLIGGEAILELQDPRAVVDTMLGAIALVSGSRTLDAYLQDMSARGQSSDRKHQVSGLLANIGNTSSPPPDPRAVFNGLRYSIERSAEYEPAPGDVDEAAALQAELARARAELASLQQTLDADIERVSSGETEPAPMVVPDGKWCCPACTFINPNASRSCQMCGTANPNAPALPSVTQYHSS